MAALLFVLGACGGDDDARVTPDAAPVPVDAPPPPSLTVQVAFDGNDFDDGIQRPVETLRRAIAIATENPLVTHIELARGLYTMRGGEAFPYTVPPNVVGISGASGGGVVLEGTGGETGLRMTGGQLQNLELENFAVAIEGGGDLRFKNLRVARSMIAIHTDDATRLRIDNLDITGFAADASRCATGIKLEGLTELIATTWTTHDLGTALDAVNVESAEHGVIDIAKANLTSTRGGAACNPVLSMLGYQITLRDVVIDGGTTGISYFAGAEVPGVITNTTLRNLNFGIQGSGGKVEIAASTISDTITAFLGGAGTWSFSNVEISRNSLGIALEGNTATGSVALKMRGCTVTSNGSGGIRIGDRASADLGTSADPGRNVIMFNGNVGLSLAGSVGQTQVDAIGNRWTPNVQGADAEGLYPAIELLVGPLVPSFGDNFGIGDGWRLQR